MKSDLQTYEDTYLIMNQSLKALKL